MVIKPRIRIGIQPKMPNLDSESKNPDLKHWLRNRYCTGRLSKPKASFNKLLNDRFDRRHRRTKADNLSNANKRWTTSSNKSVWIWILINSKCISLYLTTKGLFLPQTSSWKTLFHVFLSLKTFRQIILLFARMKYDENHRNFKYFWRCLVHILYLLLPVSTMYKVPQPSLSRAGGKKYNSLIFKKIKQWQ